MTSKISKDIEEVFALLAKIHMIQNHAAARFVRVLPHNLTMAQFSILNHLQKGRKRTPQELATHFLLSKASIGETLTKLQEKGFVTFEKNEADKRSKLVSISAAGIQARQASIKAIQPMLTGIRDDIGMETVQNAIENLYALREWFRNAD